MLICQVYENVTDTSSQLAGYSVCNDLCTFKVLIKYYVATVSRWTGK